MVLARVELDSGREIRLERLYLESTYYAVLEGYPNAGMNERVLSRLPATATRLFQHSPVHIVNPPVTPLDGGDGSWSFGPPETLPRVICFGSFTSLPISSDSEMDASVLVVVWFQDDTSMPAGRDAPSELRAIRWDELAREGPY
jgi:hypothetical protein